jgi:hypothetical protein
MATKSEQLFEAFCEQIAVEWRRVPEARKRRPDYEIYTNNTRIIAEIKQTDPNEEEKNLEKRQRKGEAVVFGTTPGERIRRALRAANPQLKQLSCGKLPALLIMYNNSPCSLHTDPYSVMTAMRGIDMIPVSVPKDNSVSPTFGDPLSGQERGMRPDANTTVSAIAVLRAVSPGHCHLDVYHNRFARTPLGGDLLRHPSVCHFRIPPNTSNSLSGWEEW